uniref:hypothetical protein n=1 Tax=Halomonas sp. TaxID=1486246 RepID=UPI00261A7988|nr:hypothetical protein [Halomonas sp.]
MQHKAPPQCTGDWYPGAVARKLRWMTPLSDARTFTSSVQEMEDSECEASPV